MERAQKRQSKHANKRTMFCGASLLLVSSSSRRPHRSLRSFLSRREDCFICFWLASTGIRPADVFLFSRNDFVVTGRSKSLRIMVCFNLAISYLVSFTIQNCNEAGCLASLARRACEVSRTFALPGIKSSRSEVKVSDVIAPCVSFTSSHILHSSCEISLSCESYDKRLYPGGGVAVKI